MTIPLPSPTYQDVYSFGFSPNLTRVISDYYTPTVYDSIGNTTNPQSVLSGSFNGQMGVNALSNSLTGAQWVVRSSSTNTTLGQNYVLAVVNTDLTVNNVATLNFNDNVTGTANGAGITATFTNHTAGSKAVFLSFFTCNQSTQTERVRLDTLGNVVLGNQVVLATNATDGFVYIPTCNGTPTGTPTVFTGKVPMVFDTSGKKIWINDGISWKGVVVA